MLHLVGCSLELYITFVLICICLNTAVFSNLSTLCGYVKIYSSLIELLFLSKNSFCMLPYISFHNGMDIFIIITKLWWGMFFAFFISNFFTVTWWIMFLYIDFFLLWRRDPSRVMASSFLRFLDHTQRRTTVGRTPLDEWSARRRDLYLTTHNAHNRQTSMPPMGFKPTISAGERPQIYVLDSAATGTGYVLIIDKKNLDHVSHTEWIIIIYKNWN